MASTGQTINDRLNAVRYALVGQGLARTVCKATTEEILAPKKKHIDYLLACTNEPNVSIPQMANLLIERTQHSNWAVVFKSLISIHHLMSHGNERFTQYLATSNHSFELAEFMDRSTPLGYNMSTFVRRYAKYINDKSLSYRTLAIDLCKIRSGNDNALRTMNMDNLSKTLPIVQSQFDSLLEFSATAKELSSSVIMSAFRLLYKDLVKLYVAYQEAIINLLERYFKLSRKKTREALEMYKNYLTRMDKVADFLRVVDEVGLDKSEMPDLTRSPASILVLLEQHLAQLEAKKRGTTPISAEEQAREDEEERQQQLQENKENLPKTEATKESADVEQKTTASGRDSSNQSTNDPSTSAASPPQKPARPSPKAAPVSSPTSSVPEKPAQQAPAATAAPTTSASPQASQEKKGPPERPAKPPSRPPPPSASSPAPPANNGANKTKVAASPTPPPHPPPPAHSPAPAHPPPPQQHAPTTVTTATAPPPPNSTTITAPISSSQQQENSDRDTDFNNNAEPASNPAPAQQPPSCSASALSSQVGEQASGDTSNDNFMNHKSDGVSSSETDSQQVENETNHVNNVEEQQQEPAPPDEEVEMPPPPPPIDDGLAEEELNGAQQPEAPQEVEDTVEPAVNGQNAEDAA